MKHTTLTLLRALLVLFLFCFSIITLPIVVIADLCMWEYYHVKQTLRVWTFKQNFIEPDDMFFSEGEKTYYRTPLDYILLRKTLTC